MRRANDPGIDMGDLIVSNSAQISAFEYPQEFGLHGQRQLSNLIEKYRATIGSFE